MGKLHELLAVEADKKNVFNKMVIETRKTFEHNEKFLETSKTYKAFEEGDKDLPDNSFKAMTTTVGAKLDYAKLPIAKYLDVILQKAVTNQAAKSDVVIRDESGAVVETIAKDVPVSALLEYEKILAGLRNDVYNGIPTIDTNIKWTVNKNEHGQIYVADDIKTIRQVKKITYDTIKVGDKFPDVVKERNVLNPVGEFTSTIKSGAISAAEKAEMLGRIDELIEAVKIARAKANSIDVINVNCGLKIMNYING